MNGVKVNQIKGKFTLLCFFSFLFLLLVSHAYINCCLLLEVRVYIVALFCTFVVVRFLAHLVFVMLFYFKMLDFFFFVVDLETCIKLYKCDCLVKGSSKSDTCFWFNYFVTNLDKRFTK